MINFGAFVIEPSLERGYRSRVIEPYSDSFDPGAYAAIRLSREEHVESAEISLAEAMLDFAAWLGELTKDRPVFWSDNPAFDWQWINHGFAVAGMRNPFGFSARRIGDLYAGLKRSVRNTQGWKKLRRTDHDHDPLNDAKGNAEALIAILREHDQLDSLIK
ncbi:MAG TPA: 3'-5' exoribonuclease [Allosphingosinicella sp.]